MLLPRWKIPGKEKVCWIIHLAVDIDLDYRGLNVTSRLLGLYEDEGDTIYGLVSLLTGSFRFLTPYSHFC